MEKENNSKKYVERDRALETSDKSYYIKTKPSATTVLLSKETPSIGLEDMENILGGKDDPSLPSDEELNKFLNEKN